jgi:hypothetical protein
MSKLVVKRVKEKIKFTEEEYQRRKEHYYMLLTSLNTVKYCIAQIGVDTLKQEHKMMFNSMKISATYFLDNIFSKATKQQDIEILQDISFNNVAAATTLFGLISKMPQEQIDWFTEECVKLSYVAYNRQNMKKDEKI